MSPKPDLGLQLVVDARATVGEGPVWDIGRGLLWWVDIPAGRVHAFDPEDGVDRTIEVGASVGAVALRRDGTLLAALADRLAVLDPETRSLETLVPLPDADPGIRCNDGKPDRAGRFWIGRMDAGGARPIGSLLCVEPDLAIETRLSGLTIPNGLGWSQDGRTMYFTDSTWHEIRAYAFDPETGRMTDPAVLLRFVEDDDVEDPPAPDGLTIDEEGCIWVARWGAGCVVRVSPDGHVVGRVEVPGVSQVSSCTFGGDDLADLYITTAHEGFGAGDLAREPHAGGLFRCRPGVRGVPPDTAAI